MTAFPDMIVSLDGLELQQNNHAIFRWTLSGTNTGPEGTGKFVRLSGREEWAIGADNLIATSLGYYDAAAYARQLQDGATPSVE